MKPDIKSLVKLNSLEAAPLLLGWVLCRRLPKGIVKAKIVETEAYHQEDPASHSYRGLTQRTWPMFESGGRLYIYFTYGMHYCLNIVVGKKGVGEGVLIRAAEPMVGLDIMRGNRKITDVGNLTNGPGKLAQALGITDTGLSGKILNPEGKYLTSQVLPTGQANQAKSRSIRQQADCYADIWLEPPAEPVNAKDIVSATRVGIKHAVDLPWRFFIRDNPFVSKR